MPIMPRVPSAIAPGGGGAGVSGERCEAVRPHEVLLCIPRLMNEVLAPVVPRPRVAAPGDEGAGGGIALPIPRL